ncbi:MAG: hypothetical protein WDN26_18765 [Chitinophagaceae bacterium]
MYREIKTIRRWIIFFMITLFLSGLTAIPLETELAFLSRCFPADTMIGVWMEKVYQALLDTNQRYPFLAYGYDWLAFAHFVLAILFIGPLKDPVRNKWVIEFGMIACLLIIPFALIAGQFRGIPFAWRLIDCSFGVVGIIPLSICLSKINSVEAVHKEIESQAAEF